MKKMELSQQITRVEIQLKHYAYSLTMNKEDALDLCQDTVLKAITYAAHFTGTSFKAWIFTIMKNLFINSYRRKVKEREWLLQSKASNGGIGNLSFDNPLSTQNYKDIIKELNQLDQSIGVPFKMFVEGYKYKEIAKIMNLPIGTIKSRIFMGRRILMGNLKDYVS
ncbi:sigma-70 family RNA polymerase sigma factor [Ancylomarina sp. DW003]|nr:sigma-70 family RNA polymerase sigma factor [Ancylomarina sp. DW003]MDE5422458.1 sigma-70 family RNA polymerase sigma factor [Ancylomarina sp. DW003]